MPQRKRIQTPTPINQSKTGRAKRIMQWLRGKRAKRTTPEERRRQIIFEHPETRKLIQSLPLKAREAAEKLQSSNPAERFRGISNLMMLDSRESVPIIRLMLKDKDPDVKRIAMSALAKFEDKKSIPEIRVRLKDADENVREIAMRILEHADDKKSIPEIKRIMLTAPNMQLRLLALSTLVKMEATQIIPTLEQIIKQNNWFTEKINEISPPTLEQKTQQNARNSKWQEALDALKRIKARKRREKST